MEHRKTLLRRKAAEIEAWALEAGVLKAGEKIEVEIRICPVPVLSTIIKTSNKEANRYKKRISTALGPEDWVKISSYPWTSTQLRVIDAFRKSENKPVRDSILLSGAWTAIETTNLVFSNNQAPYRIVKTQKTKRYSRGECERIITTVAY